MKNFLEKISNSVVFKALYGGIAMLLLLFGLVNAMLDMYHEGTYTIVFQVLAAAMLVLSLLIPGRKKTGEAGLLTFFLIWVVASRVILGDVQTGLQGSILFAAEICGAYAVGCLLNPEQRKRFLDGMSLLYGGLLFVWAVLGLLIVLTGTGYLPIIHKNIGLYEQQTSGASIRFLTFFAKHRNDTSAWFLTALWLMVYQWFACRRKLWRIPIGLAVVLFYVTIGLQHCRSVYLATAGGLGMLGLLTVMPRKGSSKPFLRWIAAVLAAAICLGAGYMGFSASDRAVSAAANVTSRIYAQIRGYAVDEEETGSSTVDQRDLLKDMKTITGRKTVWKAVLKTRLEDPKLAVVGQQEEQIIDYLLQTGAMKHEHVHTHNMFVETFAITGLPGLLILAVFLLLLTARMLRYFFCLSAPVASRILTIPLAGLMVYGMAEPMMSCRTMEASVCFALIGGILAAYERERRGVQLSVPSAEEQKV